MNKAFTDIDAVQSLKLSEVYSMMKTIKPGDKVELKHLQTLTQYSR